VLCLWQIDTTRRDWEPTSVNYQLTDCVNPSTSNRPLYSKTVIGTLAVDGCMDCYMWYSEEGPGRAAAPQSPLIAVPNVTAHPSTASVPVYQLHVIRCSKYISFAPQKYWMDFYTKFAGGNHYDEQIERLHFERHWNREWQGSGIRQNIQIDVNVKHVLRPTQQMNSQISLHTRRQMRSRTQFHVNLKISQIFI